VTNKHHIKLNNKVYDAVTGKLVDKHKPSDQKHSSDKSDLKRHTKKSGTRLISETKQATNTSPTHTTIHFQPYARKPNNINHSSLHSKQSKSTILMRKTVHKPQKIKAKSTPSAPVTPQQESNHTKASQSRDLVRHEKAKSIHKHQMVRKFNHRNHHSIEGLTASLKPLPMAVAPEPQDTTAPISHVGQKHQPLASINSFVSPKKSTTSQEVSRSSITGYLEAIEKAESHLEPQVKLPKKQGKLSRHLHLSPGMTNALLGASLLLLVAGVFAYNQAPNIAMRIASMRSGIQAQLPKYQPTGYTVNGPIKYQPGKVNMVYASRTDSGSYELSQSASRWNSEALLENFIKAQNKEYQTFQSKGRTIYVYSESNATWVDNGIWYTIESNQTLTNDQLLRIAGSL
jgi:hypothetical protein